MMSLSIIKIHVHVQYMIDCMSIMYQYDVIKYSHSTVHVLQLFFRIIIFNEQE